MLHETRNGQTRPLTSPYWPILMMWVYNWLRLAKMGGSRLDPSVGCQDCCGSVIPSVEEMLALRRLLPSSTISSEGRKLRRFVLPAFTEHKGSNQTEQENKYCFVKKYCNPSKSYTTTTVVLYHWSYQLGWELLSGSCVDILPSGPNIGFLSYVLSICTAISWSVWAHVTVTGYFILGLTAFTIYNAAQVEMIGGGTEHLNWRRMSNKSYQHNIQISPLSGILITLNYIIYNKLVSESLGELLSVFICVRLYCVLALSQGSREECRNNQYPRKVWCIFFSLAGWFIIYM